MVNVIHPLQLLRHNWANGWAGEEDKIRDIYFSIECLSSNGQTILVYKRKWPDGGIKGIASLYGVVPKTGSFLPCSAHPASKNNDIKIKSTFFI